MEGANLNCTFKNKYWKKKLKGGFDSK